MDPSANSASTPHEVFKLPISELDVNELHLCDLSSPNVLSNPFNLINFDELQSQEVYPDFLTLSTPLTSDNAVQGLVSPIASGGITKRDWLSSLSQLSRPAHPAICASSSPDLHELLDDPSSLPLQEQKYSGPRTSSVVLRLSDIRAALGPRPRTSGISLEASSPNPITLPATKPASRYTQLPNTFAQILENVDKLLQETPKEAIPAGLKRSKKSRKLEKDRSSNGHDDANSLKGLALNGRKELVSMAGVARKREVHIFSERARRRGMTHLYGTLCSLLPQGKVKKLQLDRCAVLTETMKHIEALLEQLQELGKQRTGALASIDSKVGIEPSFGNPMDADMDSIVSKVCLSMHVDSNFDNTADHTNVKAAIAIALRSYYSSLEGNSQGRRAWMCENDENNDDDDDDNDDDDNDDDGGGVDDWIVGEVDNGNDTAVYGGEGRCVRVRLFDDEAFITVWTMRKKGLWSGLLELLQQLGINVINVTVSAGPDTDHHCIHALIPSGSKLQSSQLRRCLKTYVNSMKSGFSPATAGEVTMVKPNIIPK